MCQSMVNIQSPTAEIRRGKEEEEEERNSMKILWSALLYRATIKNSHAVLNSTRIAVINLLTLQNVRRWRVKFHIRCISRPRCMLSSLPCKRNCANRWSTCPRLCLRSYSLSPLSSTERSSAWFPLYFPTAALYLLRHRRASEALIRE